MLTCYIEMKADVRHTSSSLPKNGYFLSNSGMGAGDSRMSCLLWAYVASISFEVTSFLGFLLFASSRSCDEKRSKEHLSSPIGTGGGCIHAIDGDFWDSIGCLILAGVFEMFSQVSVFTALRSLLNSLNLFCRLVTIAPYMYVTSHEQNAGESLITSTDRSAAATQHYKQITSTPITITQTYQIIDSICCLVITLK